MYKLAHVCSDFSTKPVLNPLPSPSPLSLQDDILQQWRLRRRMEEARSAAKDPVAKHHFKQGLYFFFFTWLHICSPSTRKRSERYNELV